MPARVLNIMAALTRSAKGSIIVSENQVIEVPAWPVREVVDVTGAGDLYAAGFLYGWTFFAVIECGTIAAVAMARLWSGAHRAARIPALVAVVSVVAGWGVAPILFARLDTQLAGELAGRVFTLVEWLGLACALVWLGFYALRHGGAGLRPDLQAGFVGITFKARRHYSCIERCAQRGGGVSSPCSRRKRRRAR
mgnify:CR=1 FL=1